VNGDAALMKTAEGLVHFWTFEVATQEKASAVHVTSHSGAHSALECQSS
jgi:hypothetical protein